MREAELFERARGGSAAAVMDDGASDQPSVGSNGKPEAGGAVLGSQGAD